uniref:KOW domain-containing protein n=1 Tax=Heligmosomoides polygyrus TaxID=6339 RepID=A0A8L8K7S8_HELPZ
LVKCDSAENDEIEIGNGRLIRCRKQSTAFQVLPQEGLKNENIEFIIGMPLNQVLTLIQQNSRILANVELMYSRKVASGTLFHIFFGMFLPSLTVQEKIFSEPGAEVSMDKVDEFFGSTHPGAYDDKQKICVKSWRGLSFCFPTAESANVEVTPGFGPLRSLKFDSATQPRLTKMSIFKGTAVGKNEEVVMPLAAYCGQNRTILVSCVRKNGKISGVDVLFQTQNGNVTSRINGELELVKVMRTISFGDSVAVSSALGAPSKVFYKSEDKMSIHRGGCKETLSPQPHFFFNYFSMGLSMLSCYLSSENRRLWSADRLRLNVCFVVSGLDPFTFSVKTSEKVGENLKAKKNACRPKNFVAGGFLSSLQQPNYCLFK